jgi:hypothetical protein
MTTKARKTLTEALTSSELTPEMEAFIKGDTSTSVSLNAQATKETPEIEEAVQPQVEVKQKKSMRKLTIELEEDLYDAFALACFNQNPRTKMAKQIRAWVEDFVAKNKK